MNINKNTKAKTGKEDNRVKQEKQVKQKGFGPGIKLQLVIGFMLPILFLISTSRFSYKRAEESLISNYEEATLSSISMGSKYLDFGFEMAASDTLQLALDSNLADYAYGVYANDPAQANMIYNKMQSSVTVKEASNSFMNGVSIIPKSAGKIMTTRNNAGTGFYDDWVKSEEGKKVLSGQSNYTWMGRHPFIDEKMKSTEEDYAISYIGVLTNKAACVVIDISKDAVMESLESLNLGSGSMAAFITPDNREITYYTKDEGNESVAGIEEIVFTEEAFFKTIMEKGDSTGAEYITRDNVEYFFMYSKSEVNGSILCALVPRSLVIEGALDIKNMTNNIIILACIVVSIFAIIISMNIGVSMGRIIRRLKLVAGGDLTVQLSTKGKSEFSKLSRNIMGVVGNTRKLIQKVEDTLATVQNSTERVSVVSDKIWENAEHISGAVKDIDGGVSDQSENVQSCAIMMGELSDRIDIINDSVAEVGGIAASTQKMITEGIHTIEELAGHSESTNEMSEKVTHDVGLLEEEASKISAFVDIINNISRQTNLLSLNASIEAARAGQAGRGFSVVADEIQKLADESMRAAAEIAKVIEKIQQRMVETVDAAGRAKDVVGRQTMTVKQTEEIFEQMSEYTVKLLGKLTDISESVHQADEKRSITVEAIENISAASVQTAASASVVNKTVDGQVDIAETLKAAAEELDCHMHELTETLAAFKTQ